MLKWRPLIAVCPGTFMLLLDVTIVVVAMPEIASALDASLSGLQWVLDIYALTLAALLLGGGGTLGQAVLDDGSSWSGLTAGLVVAGLGVGLVNPSVANAALASVPVENAGMAGGGAEGLDGVVPADRLHSAFATGLDTANAVAGGFGLLAAVLVLVLVRTPRTGAQPDPTPGSAAVRTG